MDAKTLNCLQRLPIATSLNFSYIQPNCSSRFRAIWLNSCKFCTKNYRPLRISLVTSSSSKKFCFTEEFRPNRRRKALRIIAKNYPSFKFGGNGGGGNNEQGRVVFNLLMAGALTYLTVTGKMGWFFDVVVSLSLFAVIVPVVGLVAFLWYAGREMLQGTCPNCGNEFQIFEFSLMDGPQLCPYCTQPFKLEEFLRDPPSKRFGGFKQPFDGFVSGPKKEGILVGNQYLEISTIRVCNEPSGIVVDVEAEVKDKK